MATMFLRELTLSVVLSRPGTEVLAVQILHFAEDGLWGKLSALGIIMIFISSTLVIAASIVGSKMTQLEVVRWEWRQGSTLFLVWQQRRINSVTGHGALPIQPLIFSLLQQSTRYPL